MAKKFLVIDIGTYNIKIAHIIKLKESVLIESPIIVRTPRFFVQNGRISDKKEFESYIREAVKKVGKKTKKAIVILNDSIVVTRDMELPAVKPKELEQMIRLDAAGFLPFELKEYSIRYKILYPSSQNPRKTNYVMMSSVKNDLAMDFIDVLGSAGLKTVAIDTTINGMIKYFKRTQEAIKSEPLGRVEALLDLGASTVRIVIFKDGIPLFQQILNHSSQRIDIMIANAINIEREEAEDLKIKHGLEFLNVKSADETARSVGSIINTQVDLMLGDIYKHFQTFIAREGLNSISRIWLCGGMAQLIGLGKYIGEAFSVPCEIIKESDKIRFSTDEVLNHVKDREELQKGFTSFANLAGAAFRGD